MDVCNEKGYDSLLRVLRFDEEILTNDLMVKRGHRRKILNELQPNTTFMKLMTPIIREYEGNVLSLQPGDSLSKWMHVLDMDSIKPVLEAEGFDSPGSVVLLTTDDLQDMKIKPAHQKHLLEIITKVSNRVKVSEDSKVEGGSDGDMSGSMHS